LNLTDIRYAMVLDRKAGEPHVKGVSFRSVLQALEALRGGEVVKNCTAQLPPDLAEAFQYGTILASGWYPIQWYRALLDSVRKSACSGEQFLFQIGRQCMLQDTTGVYRAVFNLLSPQTVIRVTPRLFNNYYDTGKCSVVDATSGYARACWIDCEQFDRNMWCELFGGTEKLLELAGAKHIRTRILAGGGDGDTSAELAGHWT
jgi:hypothetical protein